MDTQTGLFAADSWCGDRVAENVGFPQSSMLGLRCPGSSAPLKYVKPFYVANWLGRLRASRAFLMTNKIAEYSAEAFDRLLRENERLTRWLALIDGGDTPCLDDSVLRQAAYCALTLQHEPPESLAGFTVYDLRAPLLAPRHPGSSQ